MIREKRDAKGRLTRIYRQGAYVNGGWVVIRARIVSYTGENDNPQDIKQSTEVGARFMSRVDKNKNEAMYGAILNAVSAHLAQNRPEGSENMYDTLGKYKVRVTILEREYEYEKDAELFSKRENWKGTYQYVTRDRKDRIVGRQTSKQHNEAKIIPEDFNIDGAYV